MRPLLRAILSKLAEFTAMMNVKAVVDRLKSGKGDFHAHDFESYEEYEKAIEYLQALQSNGIVKIIDSVRESHLGRHSVACVVVGITEKGRTWLLTQT